DLTHDHEGYIWTPITSDKSPDSHWGYPGRLDPRTGEFTFAEMPEGARSSQFMNLAPDGTVFNGRYKIDRKALKVEDTAVYENDPHAPPGPHGVYDNAVDSKGNWWGLDFAGS